MAQVAASAADGAGFAGMLLEARADPSLTDNDGNNALDWAMHQVKGRHATCSTAQSPLTARHQECAALIRTALGRPEHMQCYRL